MIARRKKTPLTEAEKAAHERRWMKRLEEAFEPLRLAVIEHRKRRRRKG